MQIGDYRQVLWEKTQSEYRLIIFEREGAEVSILDILESGNKKWLEDKLLETLTPWNGRKGRDLRRRMA